MTKHSDFDTYLKESLVDPSVRSEYDRLQPEFEVIDAIIKARTQKGITQTKLAELIGTKQSVISRLESGRANPSLFFLKKLADALDTDLKIKFVPR